MIDWIRCPEEQATKMTQAIAQELYSTIKECVPNDVEQDERPMPLFDSSYEGQAKKLTDAVAGIKPEAPFAFPGSMPFSLSRKSMDVVCKSTYFVTEKTDGVRYLLYVLKSSADIPTAVLLARDKKFYAIRGGTEIASALGMDTILDGELVYDTALRKTVFLIFDVLAIDGVSKVTKPFSRRLDELKTVVAPRLARVSACSTADEVTTLLLKNFVRKERMQDLLAMISVQGLSKVWTSRAQRQQHLTDGLIFQPDLPYHPFLDHNLVKWKYPDLCTVDMLVTIGTETADGEVVVRPRLHCSAAEGTYIDCSKRGKDYLGLAKFDTYRLLADCEDHGARNIAEVSYDPTVGTWVYFHLRKDKIEPNFIDVVMSVFTEQAEAISAEELEYRVLAGENPKFDDFFPQLNKMMKKLIDFQRGRCGGAANSSSSK